MVIGFVPASENALEAFLVSTGIVALAEMGDKTQLLSLVLAAEFGRPLPIIIGILVATLANHGLAGAADAWITHTIGKDVLRWALGLSFLGMAVWTLKPDTLEENQSTTRRFGAFGTTVVAFFLAEIGDKTQFATVALAARYPDLIAVVAGTTLGMMVANGPAVLLGESLAKRVPMRIVHAMAAVTFAALGLLALLNVGNAL